MVRYLVPFLAAVGNFLPLVRSITSLTGAKTPVFSVPLSPNGAVTVPSPFSVPSVMTFDKTLFSMTFLNVSAVTMLFIVKLS